MAFFSTGVARHVGKHLDGSRPLPWYRPGISKKFTNHIENNFVSFPF